MPPAVQATSPVAQWFSAEPFLKWAGGKTQLLTELERFFPKTFKNYYEPFAGSAAVFFYLRRRHGMFPAALIDSNGELINCFEVVKDNLDELLPLLRHHRREHGKAHYYEVRQKEPRGLTKLKRAARLIYLNKTCYNGLYRVNAKGQFNVPMGSYRNPRIFDEADLRAASEALKGTRLLSKDFSAVLDLAKRGDLVYFDPPYYTESSGFTGYAVSVGGKAEFGAEEHRRLAEVSKELRELGCHVVVSNSNTEYIRRVYKGFAWHVVQARRLINSDGAGRGPVTELVITNRQ